MFRKKIFVYSDKKIEIRVFDNDGNWVFFDDLSDVGINELELIDLIKTSLGFIFKVDANAISVGEGRISKESASLYISRELKGLEVILPPMNDFAVEDIKFRQRFENHTREIRSLFLRDIICVQDAYCTWEASLLCPTTSEFEFDSIYIDIGPETKVNVSSFKSGRFCDYAKKCVENPEVKSAFANVVRLLTNQSIMQSGIAHKYYDDGSGGSIIIYS